MGILIFRHLKSPSLLALNTTKQQLLWCWSSERAQRRVAVGDDRRVGVVCGGRWRTERQVILRRTTEEQRAPSAMLRRNAVEEIEVMACNAWSSINFDRRWQGYTKAVNTGRIGRCCRGRHGFLATNYVVDRPLCCSQQSCYVILLLRSGIMYHIVFHLVPAKLGLHLAMETTAAPRCGGALLAIVKLASSLLFPVPWDGILVSTDLPIQPPNAMKGCSIRKLISGAVTVDNVDLPDG